MSTKMKDSSRGSGVVSLAEQAMDIQKTGYLRKLKTMKKKFFVMRKESEAGPARLECYDSEKKWKAGVLPKRTVVLRSCFNINRRADAKQRHVLALYTRDDSFALVAENEAELDEWLTEMLRLQHGSSDVDGDARPKPLFEHVWQVNVKTKGLGSSRNITGPHRLCLTASALTLVKMHTDEENPEALEFPLMSIRRCGHSDCFFFMELGRSSVTGSGELWMQTEDTVIAQNMHETILGAMKTSRNKEELGPFTRPRSSSTSENSKPITHKRPAHAVAPTTHASTSCRDRCDSMPTSRSRNSSESHGESSGLSWTHTAESTARPHSSYGRTYSVSPPSNNPITVGSFDSTSSVLSADETDGQAEYFNRYSHSLPMDIMAGPKEPTIKEEAAVDEYLMMSSPVGSSKSSHYSRPTTLVSNLCAHQQANVSESNDYLKMSMSPASNVPEGNGDGYIPMSPVGSMSLSSSLEKAAAPSSSADTGYLSMEPQGGAAGSCTTMRPVSHATCSSPTVVHAGFPTTVLSVPPSEYLDMAPLSSSLPKSVGESCTDFSGSWCSAHSLQDVPSSSSPLSASLEGFHLDKVKSYFSPSEDDSEAFIKPVRAYSIGSRQQVKKTSFAGHLEQSRVRAYSVGSQVAPTALRRRMKKDTDTDVNATQRLEGQKSSSVPTLQEDASHQAPRALNYNEDLMEINYDRSDLGQGSSTISMTDKSSVLPPTSTKQSEGSEVVRKLSTASTPSTTKTFDDYMLMTGSESSAGVGSSAYQHPLTSPTSSDQPERKVSISSSSRQRKEDLGKENHPGGRSSSYAGIVRRSSTTQQALREDNAVPVTSLPPSNGVNQSKTDNDYVATEMTKKGVAFLSTSNGTVSKGKSGLSYHMGVPPVTTASLRPASPESQQLGEYVNLDLSKTMKWTQPVKMPVSSGDTTPTTSSANGSSSWSSGPKLPSESSGSFARAAPLAVAESSYVQLRGLADPSVGAAPQQVPPEANYENISLKGGAAEAPAERVLNYASLDLAPPSGEDGTPGAVQRSPRAAASTPVDPDTEEGPTFSYAEIDFTKSEGLRNVSGYRS
nr:insulin receptor substrate 2-A-like isoform X2 [Dermacentor andersoni]XP_054922204.1 insulin receptor substrate 2-A-like isoform X2 [Dermacentor andersoni]XP_054922205.1 insulin receptor substrate 2-A-like isoform X2 [Dermacentor andersoni]